MMHVSYKPSNLSCIYSLVNSALATMRPDTAFYTSHTLHLLHNSADGQGVTIDGTSLDSESWTPIPGSEFVYLEYAATADATYDIQSATGGFLAYVSGLESTSARRGHLFSVERGDVSTGPPATTDSPSTTTTPASTIPTPLQQIVLTGEFESEGGEDFSMECAEAYQYVATC